MSQNAGISVSTRKSRLKILLLFLSVLLLLLVYGVGFIVLPFSAYVSFQNKNCNFALTLYKVYTSLYPEFVRDASLSDPARECEAYALASSNETDENWRGAYDAYQDYLRIYPNGLYVAEAHEHSAMVLMNITKEQVEQKKYDEAVKNLDLLVSGYSDTSVSTDAWMLLSSAFTSWGTDLREAGDFEKSEKVFNDFKACSETHQKADLAMEAQRELAQTYVAWGMDLQSQRQFEDALAKFDLAASVDPGEQVESARRNLYIEWGNDLLDQEQFPAAMEKFELAVAKLDGTNDKSAQDAFVNGQIRWAGKLSADEDFLGALEHLGFAKEAAASDTMNESVDTALQDTYLAFSSSSGQQARRAIKEALKSICEEHKAPELPIFGLNKDSIRFGIYGVEDQLPKDLAARTPGEMHYVACITADNRTVQTRYHKNIVFRTSKGYYYTMVEQFRVQIIWNVSLLQVDTIASAGEQSFTGAPPPPFPNEGGNYFYGPTPMDEFAAWLQSFIE